MENHPESTQCIGIIALSSPCEPSRFQLGLEELGRLGIGCKVMLDPCGAFGKTDFLFSSDTPGARARALEDLFSDPSVTAVLAARGAYGSFEILEYLDLSRIAESTKPLIGFSDTTAVLLAAYGAGAKKVIHGPSFESSFCRASRSEPARESGLTLIRYLTGEIVNPFERYPLQRLFGPGEMRGPLSGGNLSIITSLLGTRWQPDFAGHILFLEDVGERPYRVHRMLSQLRAAGCTDGLRGVILGSFKNCVHPQGLGPAVLEVIKDAFSPLGVPVFGFLPSGHEDLNVPVPFGIPFQTRGEKLVLA